MKEYPENESRESIYLKVLQKLNRFASICCIVNENLRNKPSIYIYETDSHAEDSQKYQFRNPCLLT